MMVVMAEMAVGLHLFKTIMANPMVCQPELHSAL
jgi:hypothetical protein